MATNTKLKRVMKRASELRKDGNSASKSMKKAWSEEKTKSQSTTKKANKPASKKKKFLGLF